MPSATHSPKIAILSSRPRFLILAALLAGLTLTLISTLLTRSSQERSLQSSSVADLKELAAKNPGDERILYHLARKQESGGDVRAAMDSYWRALQLDQNDEAAWIGWARVTNAVLGPEKARQVMFTSLQALPKSASIHVELARLEQQLGNHNAALAVAAKAAELDRANVNAWQIAGAEAAMLQQYQIARDAFQKAVDLSLSDWSNRAGLGDALSHMGRRQEAVTAFREAARLAPRQGVTHLMLGTEMLMTATSDTEIDAARNELAEADRLRVSLPPSARFQAALMLGDSYRRQKQWKQALDCYTRAQALSPFDPAVQYNLVRVYRGMGNVDAANRAEARHAELDRANRQIKVLALRVDVVPDDYAARLKLARLYSSFGQLAKAAMHYRALAAFGPTAEIARKEMAALSARTGNLSN